MEDVLKNSEKLNVYDLHCDLLLYLAHSSERTPFQKEARASIPQLKEGGVLFQTMALFTTSKPGCSENGRKQIEAFKKMRGDFLENSITIQPALENGSLLVEEGERLDLAFERFEKYEKEVGPFLYVSLTWNMENRFGGGNATTIGLKKEGELLLDFLSDKNIAIDLSHTSDALAWGILKYLDKNNLKNRVVASHSNFRAITSHARNLPDELAQELFRRKGIMGLNLIRSFVGEEGEFESKFLQMVERGLELGGEDSLCFGADFFCEDDILGELSSMRPFFNSGYPDASSYPRLITLLRGRFAENIVRKIAHENVQKFRQGIYENSGRCRGN